MQNYLRQQSVILHQRLSEPPEQLIVITGPRQVGKTTLIRQTLRDIDLPSRYLSTDNPYPSTQSPSLSLAEGSTTSARQNHSPDTAWLLESWEQARREAADSRRGFVLVLDEIQKISHWSESVKGLWDNDRDNNSPLRVVLLGSAPLLMQQGLTESLAGRFELIRLNHWSYSEMAEAFNFDFSRYVYFGGYPGASKFIAEQSRWRDYIRASLIEPNIDRDILSMTRVDKPALLKRTFELGSDYSGQILSYTKMQGQLQDAGNTTTLAHYLTLLSQAGMLTGLQKYAGEQHRRRASSPKLIVLNTAFMAVASGYSFEEAQTDRSFWGRLVESTIGAHLINSGQPDISVYYWRSGHHEIDFVITKGRRVIGIEVKSGRHNKVHQGLKEFERQFSPEKILIIGSGGVHLEEFLQHPASHWFNSS